MAKISPRSSRRREGSGRAAPEEGEDKDGAEAVAVKLFLVQEELEATLVIRPPHLYFSHLLVAALYHNCDGIPCTSTSAPTRLHPPAPACTRLLSWPP